MEETPRTDKIVADWLGGKISAAEMRRQFQNMERDLIRAQVKFVERGNDDKKYLVDPICCLEMGLEDCQAALAAAEFEIERKNEIIKRMRDALGEAIGVLPRGHKEYEKCEAALSAAERGKYAKDKNNV